MKKSLTQKLGLLGVVSFLSYTAAVVFSPLAYPSYKWMEQAVSDLSASDSPSLALWNQLSALYNTCEIVCAIAVCIGIQGQKTKWLYGSIPGCDAHDHHRIGGLAVYCIADCCHNRWSKKQRLPLLRSMRVNCSRHDACRCNWHENRPCKILRHC